MKAILTSTATTVARTAFCGALVAWAALSASRQFTAEGNVKLQRADPYGMITPNYHFFCPEPAQHDMNLLYRDKLADGEIGPWQEVVLTERRRLSHMVFYAKRRLDKGMMDLSGEVVRFARLTGDLNRLSLTRQYMSVLNLVTYGVSHDPRAVQTQYAFAHSAAYEPAVEPYVTFVSNFHSIPSRESAGRTALAEAAA